MAQETSIAKCPVSWGVASRALPGQSVCGDLHLIRNFADGVLIAVVDGLGHGEEAAVAARTALAVLENHPEAPLNVLVQSCHEALIKTRGAVMTLAFLQCAERQLTWLGVGNVEAVLVSGSRPTRRAVVLSGVVGYQLPALRASAVPMAPGDLLVFVTDGIDAGFPEELPSKESPQGLADRILERHFKGNDDALVLAVRCLGNSA
jgi:serine phosphatase RsbU (regulator of sigma subunit)